MESLEVGNYANRVRDITKKFGNFSNRKNNDFVCYLMAKSLYMKYFTIKQSGECMGTTTNEDVFHKTTPKTECIDKKKQPDGKGVIYKIGKGKFKIHLNPIENRDYLISLKCIK